MVIIVVMNEIRSGNYVVMSVVCVDFIIAYVSLCVDQCNLHQICTHNEAVCD